MKNIITCYFILLLSLTIGAQSINEVNQLISEGIEYHDNGQYEKAVQTYKKALAIDPTNSTANYEIAYSYSSLKDYDQAIRYCDIVLKGKSENPTMAYVTKANCLDKKGLPKKAIKVYKKAIKKTGHHYLLHYNLGLTYFTNKEYKLSSEQAIAAITNNPGHASSHLILAYSQMYLGNKTQTLLALNYFLLLEHDTQRAEEALKIFKNQLIGDIESDTENGVKTININISENTDETFMTAELSLAILDMTKGMEQKDDKTADGEELKKTEHELLIYKLSSYYIILGELKKEEASGIYWDLYISKFYQLAESDHFDAFYYFFTNTDEESKEWMRNHTNKVIAFAQWLEKNE